MCWKSGKGEHSMGWTWIGGHRIGRRVGDIQEARKYREGQGKASWVVGYGIIMTSGNGQHRKWARIQGMCKRAGDGQEGKKFVGRQGLHRKVGDGHEMSKNAGDGQEELCFIPCGLLSF